MALPTSQCITIHYHSYSRYHRTAYSLVGSCPSSPHSKVPLGTFFLAHISRSVVSTDRSLRQNSPIPTWRFIEFGGRYHEGSSGSTSTLAQTHQPFPCSNQSWYIRLMAKHASGWAKHRDWNFTGAPGVYKDGRGYRSRRTDLLSHGVFWKS